MERPSPALLGPDGIPPLFLYLAIGPSAGAVIALQICIMRIFAVGSWAHFGSLVVSLAMLGFGLASAIMCVAENWFEQHWRGAASTALVLFGPLTVASNLLAQEIPFNPIFIVADWTQKWRLVANFLLYLLPFLAGAFFLGVVFLKSRATFGRVYFADLAGAGLSGMVLLGAMYVFAPENLLTVPLLLWCAGSLFWFAGLRAIRALPLLIVVAAASFGGHYLLPQLVGVPKLSVSDYKGVAYQRKFPDNSKVYENVSPFGDLEIYSSSYLHFAPGLSDNAAFNLPEIPENAYLGLFIDGDGPSGVIRNLPAANTAYFRFLPMYYPYVLKPAPDTFVVQFGGGISTAIALRSNARSVTVAEGNQALLGAFLNDKGLRDFTGDILHNPKVHVVNYDGRLYLAETKDRFDVIDLSLADSAGLSSPGGYAIVEKYAYTREAMLSYMRALKDGGILSATLWNKEEPPKSVLKLYTTMAAAARAFDATNVANSFFVASSYLSTATVLYKRGGFTDGEIAALRQHTHAMSFDEIYSPGQLYDTQQTAKILDGYRNQIFGDGATADASNPAEQLTPPDASPPEPSSDAAEAAAALDTSEPVPATTMGRLVWHYLMLGGWDEIASRYVFDTRALTNDRPYFAAFVKPADLPRTTDRLDLFQDEWGYLSLWATFAVAGAAAFCLVLFPVAFGWRAIFSRNRGKLATIVYFGCLGLGYIMVEVGLIAKFVQALSNPTISASVLIAGMLVFSGLGSLASGQFVDRARTIMPAIFLAIGVALIGYGFLLDRALDWIGAYPYAWRLVFCFFLIGPPAFLMGFPMPTAMTALGRLGKKEMFVWAWGINGCFSVVGAALVPLVATSFGLSAVLQIGGVAYLLAIPALFGVLLPGRNTIALGAGDASRLEA